MYYTALDCFNNAMKLQGRNLFFSIDKFWCIGDKLCWLLLMIILVMMLMVMITLVMKLMVMIIDDDTNVND